MFNLAIDSKLRGCDLVRLQIDDVRAGGRVRDRATVIQKKTGRPVQFEITEQTRAAIQAWLSEVDGRIGLYLFPSRFRTQPHLSTRQYAAKSDPAEAAYWYALAAADNEARAFTNLGTLAARGQIVAGKPDLDAARLLWWAGAARSDAIAMYNLGVIYERGMGVMVDLKRARAWYDRAAARNHVDARAALKRLGL